MPLPADVSTVRFIGPYRGFDGEPASGTIEFYPTVSEVRSASGVTLLRNKEPLTALISETGDLDIQVLATDDPDVSPSGWGYLVVERFDNRVNKPPYTVLAPAGADIVLAAAVPAVPVTQLASYVRTVNGQTPDANGAVTVTAAVGSVDWTAVLNKPATFPPSSHTHAVADVTGLQSALDGKEASGTASAAVAAHEAAADPHPGYLTQAEGDARYAAIGSGGGSGSTLKVRQAYVTSGNIQLNVGTNTWGPLAGFATLSVPAVVGDYVELAVHAMRQTNSNIFLDTGVVVSSSVVRYLSTGTATPAGEGDVALYHTNLPAISAPRGFTVTAGDLSGGSVTFCVAIRNLAAASALLLASTDNPFFWRAINYGSVA